MGDGVKVADLVWYKDQHWVVSRFDPRRTKTATLLATSGRVEEVRWDADVQGEVVVLAHPFTDWPFVTLKERPKFGPLRRVVRIKGPMSSPIEEDLAIYKDWVPSDPVRSGGPIFFSPALDLKAGEQLIVILERGRARLVVPSNFLTVANRVALSKPTEREAKTVFTHLLDDDTFEK